MARKTFEASGNITRSQVARLIAQCLPRDYAMPALGDEFRVEFQVNGEEVKALLPID